MRARLVPLLLAAVLVAAGLAVVASASSAQTVPARQTATTAEDPRPSKNDTDLLTRSELFAAVDANASGHSAALYYVAQNGSWYHASANGSVGSPAPGGAAHPRTDDEHEVPRGERPTYLWKVVSDDGCDVVFSDARNASTVAAMPIPSCPPPTPPTSTPTATDEPDSTAGGRSTTASGAGPDTDATDGGSLPGFGVVVSVVALLLAGRFVHRW